jgi:hypothetical protein
MKIVALYALTFVMVLLSAGVITLLLSWASGRLRLFHDRASPGSWAVLPGGPHSEAGAAVWSAARTIAGTIVSLWVFALFGERPSWLVVLYVGTLTIAIDMMLVLYVQRAQRIARASIPPGASLRADQKHWEAPSTTQLRHQFVSLVAWKISGDIIGMVAGWVAFLIMS